MKPTRHILILLAGVMLATSLSSCDKIFDGDLFSDLDFLGEYKEKSRDPQLQGWWLRADNGNYLYFDCDKGTVFNNSSVKPEPDSVPDTSTKTYWYTLDGTIHIYYNSMLNPDYAETITYAFIDNDKDTVYRKDTFSGNLTVWMTRPD